MLDVLRQVTLPPEGGALVVGARVVARFQVHRIDVLRQAALHPERRRWGSRGTRGRGASSVCTVYSVPLSPMATSSGQAGRRIKNFIGS